MSNPETQPQATRDERGQHPDGGAALVGVYLQSTPSNRPPDRYIALDDAQYEVAIGNAESINRGKAIRLLPGQRRRIEETEQRGFSCRPGTGRHNRGAENLFRELREQAQEAAVSRNAESVGDVVTDETGLHELGGSRF